MSDNDKTVEDTEMDAATETAETSSENGGEPTPEEREAKLVADLDAMRDRLLRAVAESENTRKRTEKELQDTRQYAVSKFARDMLEVADNLSRALSALDAAELENASEPLRNLVEGVAMTEKQLVQKMESHGVTKLAPEPGEVFDPNLHQAVAQIPSDQPAGKVAALMQPGYTIGARTLRAAMVAVSAGQPAAPSGDTGGSVDVTA